METPAHHGREKSFTIGHGIETGPFPVFTTANMDYCDLRCFLAKSNLVAKPYENKCVCLTVASFASFDVNLLFLG